MELAKILSSLNSEVKAYLLGYGLEYHNRVRVSDLVEEISYIAGGTGIRCSRGGILHHLRKFGKEGIVSVRNGKKPMNNADYDFVLEDQRYSDAARLLLAMSDEFDTCIFSIFGIGGNGNKRRSSLENRLHMIDALSDGESRTLNEIISMTGVSEVPAYDDLHALGRAGIVNTPASTSFDGNSYRIEDKRRLNKYFEGRLTSMHQKVLEYCRNVKEFRAKDILESDEADVKSIGHIRRELLKIERAGVITSTMEKGEKIFSVSEKYFKGGKARMAQMEYDLFEIGLKDNDLMFYNFVKGFFNKKRGGDFRTSDLKPYFNQVQNLHVLNRLKDEGYIEIIFDQTDHKKYSLTERGKHLLNDYLNPISGLFNHPSRGKAGAAGQSDAQDPLKLMDYLKRCFERYSKVCPYNKRASDEDRAASIAVALGNGPLSFSRIAEELGLNTNGTDLFRRTLNSLVNAGSVQRNDSGPFSLYSLTEQGREKYME